MKIRLCVKKLFWFVTCILFIIMKLLLCMVLNFFNSLQTGLPISSRRKIVFTAWTFIGVKFRLTLKILMRLGVISNIYLLLYLIFASPKWNLIWLLIKYRIIKKIQTTAVSENRFYCGELQQPIFFCRPVSNLGICR